MAKYFHLGSFLLTQIDFNIFLWRYYKNFVIDSFGICQFYIKFRLKLMNSIVLKEIKRIYAFCKIGIFGPARYWNPWKSGQPPEIGTSEKLVQTHYFPKPVSIKQLLSNTWNQRIKEIFRVCKTNFSINYFNLNI